MGYEPGTAVPSTLQILDGLPPANSAAVRVDITPGSQWRYSGGGFVLLQQLLEDIGGQGFEALLQREVLAPAGMARSSFALTPAQLAQGRNMGFDARWLADQKDGGRSVVVMANANGAMPLINELVRGIAQALAWADWQAPTQAALKAKLQTTPLFVRGSLNDWGLGLPMQRLARHRFVATVALPAGRIEFKLASEDWGQVDLGLASDRAPVGTQMPLTVQGANVPFDVKKPGHYRFLVDMGHPSGPRVQIKQLPSTHARAERL